MNDLAKAYAARRTTPPMTQEECDALQRENDLDPTGEYGLRILDRHLLAIDRVRELCRKNPNKPKVRAAILTEYEALRQCIREVSAEALAAFEKRQGAGHGSP